MGKVDLEDMVPKSEVDWHERPCNTERWRSTNHFMGHGYWAWLIPLSTGYTSVGLVIHDDPHGIGPIKNLDATMDFLREHEIRALMEKGGHHFERSLAGDGVSPVRTSKTSWCNVPFCEGDPTIKSIKHRVANVTGVPLANSCGSCSVIFSSWSASSSPVRFFPNLTLSLPNPSRANNSGR
mgnify:CR=1 FL=1